MTASADYSRAVDAQLLYVLTQLRLAETGSALSARGYMQAACFQLQFALQCYVAEITGGESLSRGNLLVLEESGGLKQVDFRFRELVALVAVPQSWLNRLLRLLASLHSPPHFPLHSGEVVSNTAFQSADIIVSSNQKTSDAIISWYDIDCVQIYDLYEEFQKIVNRQRELSLEL